MARGCASRRSILVARRVVAWDASRRACDPVAVWAAVAIVAAGVLPATLLLIYLALPLWSRRRLVAIGSSSSWSPPS